MLVRDALLPNPLMVSPETSALDFVIQVLDSNQTTAVVTNEARELLGIVSVQDVYRRILPHYVDMDHRLAEVMHEGYFEEKFEGLKTLPVEKIMTRDVRTLSADDAVIKAVGMFCRGGRKTVPVVEDGKYVGSLTRRSVLREVTKHPRK